MYVIGIIAIVAVCLAGCLAEYHHEKTERKRYEKLTNAASRRRYQLH